MILIWFPLFFVSVKEQFIDLIGGYFGKETGLGTMRFPA